MCRPVFPAQVKVLNVIASTWDVRWVEKRKKKNQYIPIDFLLEHPQFDLALLVQPTCPERWTSFTADSFP